MFSQHNVRTVMGTAQAGAVAIACAARRGLPVALHTPSEVKAAVTGNGRADKAQVGGHGHPAAAAAEPRREPADAADALALAICHVWRGAPRAQPARRRRRAPSAPPEEQAMIRSCRGRVAALTADGAVVEVGGFGLA